MIALLFSAWLPLIWDGPPPLYAMADNPKNNVPSHRMLCLAWPDALAVIMPFDRDRVEPAYE